MSEVKRLSLDLEYPFQYREDTEGSLCYYADYAALKEQFDFKKNLTEQVVALEQQRDALAADLEKFAVQCAAAKIAVQYAQASGFECTLNTPAVDAYLNSVRAEGLKMAIDHMNNQTSDNCADVTVLPVIEMYNQLRAGETS